LWHQLEVETADARKVATRSGEAVDQAEPDRVATAEEDNRDARGSVFRRYRPRDAACPDHFHLAADEVGRQSREPVKATLRPGVFASRRWPLYIPGLAKCLADRSKKRCSRAGRASAEHADHRHRLLPLAASGHAAIAPARKIMKSRRLMPRVSL